MQTMRASCHCQAVRVEVQCDPDHVLAECNCSICARVGYLHLIVPRDRFSLVEGETELTSYRFNSGVANHLFCRICGVKVFYIPRSHPEGISVNARCLDDELWRRMAIKPFDGQNWEANVSQIQ
ncbi:MAG: GFA family protein [Pseudomonadota bacterium]